MNGTLPPTTLTRYLNEAGSCSGTAMFHLEETQKNFVRRIIERLIDVSDDHANSLDPTSPLKSGKRGYSEPRSESIVGVRDEEAGLRPALTLQ